MQKWILIHLVEINACTNEYLHATFEDHISLIKKVTVNKMHAQREFQVKLTFYG